MFQAPALSMRLHGNLAEMRPMAMVDQWPQQMKVYEILPNKVFAVVGWRMSARAEEPRPVRAGLSHYELFLLRKSRFTTNARRALFAICGQVYVASKSEDGVWSRLFNTVLLYPRLVYNHNMCNDSQIKVKFERFCQVIISYYFLHEDAFQEGIGI